MFPHMPTATWREAEEIYCAVTEDAMNLHRISKESATTTPRRSERRVGSQSPNAAIGQPSTVAASRPAKETPRPANLARN
jgi:hypothetical protein